VRYVLCLFHCFCVTDVINKKARSLSIRAFLCFFYDLKVIEVHSIPGSAKWRHDYWKHGYDVVILHDCYMLYIFNCFVLHYKYTNLFDTARFYFQVSISAAALRFNPAISTSVRQAPSAPPINTTLSLMFFFIHSISLGYVDDVVVAFHELADAWTILSTSSA